MHQRLRPILACAAALGLLSTPILAQSEDTPPPEQPESQKESRPDTALNPLLTDTSLDEQMRLRTSRPAGGISIPPAQGPSIRQVVPNLPADAARYSLADGTAAWAPGKTLRPEGTFLVGWTGEIVRLRTGGLAFLPAIQEKQHGSESRTGENRAGENRATGSPSASHPEPAMALLPCATYTRLESMLGEENRGLWVSLTGEVLEYHGRNFLLPTAFANAQTPTEPAEGAEAPPSEAAGSPADQPEPSGNRIDELVRELEAQRAERRGIDTTFATPSEEQTGMPVLGPRVDGTMLLNQRGRMVRSGEGGWVIAIDNDDAASEGGLPHHLWLLPCRVVAQMEWQAEIAGESWAFEVSGRLYRHGQRVYLLPRMFVSASKNDVQPLQ